MVLRMGTTYGASVGRPDGISEGARLGTLLGAFGSSSSDGTPMRFGLGDPAGCSVGNSDGGAA